MPKKRAGDIGHWKEKIVSIAQYQERAMLATRSSAARCRGVRRMHLPSNMSACEQAPGSQTVSSEHGSL